MKSNVKCENGTRALVTSYSLGQDQLFFPKNAYQTPHCVVRCVAGTQNKAHKAGKVSSVVLTFHGVQRECGKLVISVQGQGREGNSLSAATSYTETNVNG